MEIGKSEYRKPDCNKDLASVACLSQGRSKLSSIILNLFLKHRYFLHLCMWVYICFQISIDLNASSERVSGVREEQKSEFGHMQAFWAFCLWCSSHLSQAHWALGVVSLSPNSSAVSHVCRLMESLMSDRLLLRVHTKDWEFYTVL